MTRISATDASRGFSEVLNRVAAGEELEVTRGGAPIAVISPPKARTLSAARFRELVATAPKTDQDFASDLRKIRASVGEPRDPWRS